jgi:glycosyltransferase involved in cell wall biosynthesis
MKVSVIIPTYNRGIELKRCLYSLVSQTYKNFEVIVCDDGSVDNTEEVTMGFRDKLNIKYDKDQNFGGPAKPRNRGIRLSSNDAQIIAFLDSDDWWYPNKLEETLKYMHQYDVVYHDLDIYKLPEKKIGIAKGRNLKIPIVEDLIVYGNGLPNSSVLIKKKIIDKVGFLSEDKKLIAVEDAEFWIRVSQFTEKFFYLKGSFGVYWVGKNISVSVGQIEKMNLLMEKYIHLLSPQKAKKAAAIQTFNNARTYHQLNLYSEAIPLYKSCILIMPVSYKLKCFIGICLSYFKVNV